jgi:hypothetical protein
MKTFHLSSSLLSNMKNASPIRPTVFVVHLPNQSRSSFFSSSSSSFFPAAGAAPPGVGTSIFSPSLGCSVKTTTNSGSSVERFLRTYLSECVLCVSKNGGQELACLVLARVVGVCLMGKKGLFLPSFQRMGGSKNQKDLPEWLAVPEADDGDCNAGDEAVAWEAEGEVCDSKTGQHILHACTVDWATVLSSSCSFS